MLQSFFHHHLQFSRFFTKKLNEKLAGIGLYHSQWLIVYFLMQFGPSTLIEISQYLNVEKPTISRTADRLENSGLIEKVPSSDKRERRIQLSHKGEQVYHKAKLIVEGFEDNLLEGVSKGDMETAFRTIQSLKEKLT
nr:MarR family transcriptional regulator [uncultured Bacillus sp.]